MITYAETIADAYTLPPRSIMVPTTPGRTVRFLQGHASLKVDTDLMALMRRSDVKLVFTPFAMSWFEDWMAQVGDRLQAELLVPDDVDAPVEPEAQTDPNMQPQMSWDPAVRQEMQGGDNSQGSGQGTE